MNNKNHISLIDPGKPSDKTQYLFLIKIHNRA